MSFGRRVWPGQQRIIDGCDALRKHAIKVMDLFREWDVDGDGEVTKKEFRKAMAVLGFEVSRAVMDEVFDSFDADVHHAMHHVILVGDLNFRCAELSAGSALSHLVDGALAPLLEADELRGAMDKGEVTAGRRHHSLPMVDGLHLHFGDVGPFDERQRGEKTVQLPIETHVRQDFTAVGLQ